MLKFADIKAKNFPYVTVAYLFFIIIVNTVVKTKYPINYKLADLYGSLYSKNAGFLIPFIDALAVPGLFTNSGENDGAILFGIYTHIFFALLLGGMVIELNYGHSAMALFILMSMLAYYFIYIVSSLFLNKDKRYAKLDFRYYNCCSTGIFAFLIGSVFTALFFDKKNTKLLNIIFGILLPVLYIVYYLYDYGYGYTYLELKDYKGEKGSILRELYKVVNMELVKASFFGNSLNYLFGVIIFALFYRK
jgi:hypothetical protein